jgi:hypothetical protein
MVRLPCGDAHLPSRKDTGAPLAPPARAGVRAVGKVRDGVAGGTLRYDQIQP